MSERVIMITGGSSGIGKATAELFVQAGDIVYVTGRDSAKLEAARDSFNNERVHSLAFDVSKVAECQRALDYIVSQEGGLDVLVNSAGVSVTGDFETMASHELDAMIDINLKGTIYMCQSAISALKESHGNIVNVSSDAGLIGNAGLAAYSATKGAVTLLTKALAVELAPVGVRVNAVCPGEVDTPMVTMEFERSGHTTREAFDQEYLGRYPQKDRARYTRPEEVAACIFFLADTERIEAVTGACLSVDFGITAGY